MNLRPSLKARALISVALLAILFTFQNCGKVPMTSGVSDADPSNKLEANQYSQLSMADEHRNLALKVDLNSGAIEKIALSNPSDISQKCLSDEDRRKLDEILFEAQICQGYQMEGVCTQIISPAYATLSEGSESVDLGGRNGCYRSADLCGQRSIELRVFLDELKVRVDSMNCQ